MPSQVWGDSSYLFPSFNGCTVEVYEWFGNFIPHVMRDVITYPCWATGRIRSRVSPCTKSHTYTCQMSMLYAGPLCLADAKLAIVVHGEILLGFGAFINKHNHGGTTDVTFFRCSTVIMLVVKSESFLQML